MNKAIRNIYTVLAIIGAFLILWALVSESDNRYVRSSNVGKQELVPDSVTSIDEDTIEYCFSVQEEQDTASCCVEFYSNHQFIYAYADGELIYSLYPQASVFGNTTGSQYNFIELPAGTTQLTIDIEAVYPQVRGRTYTFYIGDTLTSYQNYIKRSMFNTAISFLLVVSGAAMAALWLIFHKRLQQGPSLFYFGLAVTILGLWSLNETDFVTIMFADRRAASFISFLLLMLEIMPYVKFVHYFLEVPDRLISNAISLLSMVSFVVLTLLHMTGIVALKQTAICIHVLLGMAFLYMVGSLIWRFRKFGLDRLMKVNLIAAAMIFVSIFVDIAAFYFATEQTDVVGRVALFVYVMLMAYVNIGSAIRRISEGKKAEFYRQMAESDVMTGMKNRSAFEKWEAEKPEIKDIAIVTFDLNNLKYHNDNMGHAAGDRYIVDAAGLIRQCFGSYAQCYRIGGDEFCAVVKKSQSEIERCIENLRNAEWVYNRTSTDVDMKIACGYAFYQAGDRSAEDIRSRADSRMYYNKEKLKENN
jgi:diguanylate cyclase (GGDEF)-like protein